MRPSGEPISSSATETTRTGTRVEQARVVQRAERVADDDEAALHVEDAGAAQERAVLAEAGEGGLGEHGVVVADEQHRAVRDGGGGRCAGRRARRTCRSSRRRRRLERGRR